MISHILAFSIQRRWLVVLFSLGAAVLGAWSLNRLPIDAVPDITNKQVQVNTTAPALSPAEIEKQVTLRIETALAGIPGLESTRSLSRNGFSQVTAIFTERTDIYFARQQVSERLIELRAGLAAGCRAATGTDLHGPRRNLYVGRRLCARCGVRARAAGKASRWLIPHAGWPTAHIGDRAGGISEGGSGLDHPASAQGRPRRGGGGFHRRIRQTVPRATRPLAADRARPVIR